MPLTSIQFTNAAPPFRIPRKHILRGLEVTFAPLKQRVGTSLVFVPDREMIRLHNEFLHLRRTTDVLTFVLEQDKKALLTEIFVCVDTAKRQANENRVSLRNEIVRLCVHGALHAAGFDDHTPRKRAAMWRRQEFIVEQTHA